MYRNIANRIPSPSPIQTETCLLFAQPEDLSSPHPSTSSSRSSSVGPGSAPNWSINNNRLLVFCDIVLKHVNYPHAFLEPCDDEQEESSEENKNDILKTDRSSSSPLNSVGESARDSTRSSTSSTESVLAELDPEEVDKATYESVSCWCGKPFAGRPMIECDYCLVWYHMSCEQVRRSNIPIHFQCSRCKEEKRRRKKRPAPKDGSSRKGEKKKKKKDNAAATPRLSTSSPTSSSVPILDSPVRISSPRKSISEHEPELGTPFSSPFREDELKPPILQPTGILMHELRGSPPPPPLLCPAPTNNTVPPPPPLISSYEKERTKSKDSRSRHKKSKAEGKRRRSSGGGAKSSSMTSTPPAAPLSSSVLSPVGLSSGPAGCQQPPVLPYKTHPHSVLISTTAAATKKLSHVTVYGDKGESSPPSRSLYSSSSLQQPPVLTAAPKPFIMEEEASSPPRRPTSSTIRNYGVRQFLPIILLVQLEFYPPIIITTIFRHPSFIHKIRGGIKPHTLMTRNHHHYCDLIVVM
ncbi:PHD finger protein 23 [Orchesella cincta]|uniref:PHD finger protein 23 n=1 Tax=Orchesella cincta TaxID=48709 RepID=A0A1D2MQG1_ORCCI|nr:PHD finger protein 23 [Orchesella cincta]